MLSFLSPDNMGQDMRKRVLSHMRTTKVQISLRIRAVCSLISTFVDFEMKIRICNGRSNQLMCNIILDFPLGVCILGRDVLWGVSLCLSIFLIGDLNRLMAKLGEIFVYLNLRWTDGFLLIKKGVCLFSPWTALSENVIPYGKYGHRDRLQDNNTVMKYSV